MNTNGITKLDNYLTVNQYAREINKTTSWIYLMVKEFKAGTRKELPFNLVEIAGIMFVLKPNA